MPYRKKLLFYFLEDVGSTNIIVFSISNTVFSIEDILQLFKYFIRFAVPVSNLIK